MRGRRPAAAADRIDPPLLDEASHLEREALGRLLVVPALVRQSRVGIRGDEAGRHLAERAQVIRHELRTRGAIEPDVQKFEMIERSQERLDGLTRAYQTTC